MRLIRTGRRQLGGALGDCPLLVNLLGVDCRHRDLRFIGAWRARGRRFLAALVLTCLATTSTALAEASKSDLFVGLASEYAEQTRPLMRQFCLDCHSTAKQTGELDLERFAVHGYSHVTMHFNVPSGTIAELFETVVRFGEEVLPAARAIDARARGWS